MGESTRDDLISRYRYFVEKINIIDDEIKLEQRVIETLKEKQYLMIDHAKSLEDRLVLSDEEKEIF